MPRGPRAPARRGPAPLRRARASRERIGRGEAAATPATRGRGAGRPRGETGRSRRRDRELLLRLSRPASSAAADLLEVREGLARLVGPARSRDRRGRAGSAGCRPRRSGGRPRGGDGLRRLPGLDVGAAQDGLGPEQLRVARRRPSRDGDGLRGLLRVSSHASPSSRFSSAESGSCFSRSSRSGRAASRTRGR